MLKESLSISTRWSRDDWVNLAIERLKADGPSAVTLERLCGAARRTKGSFYHHFESVDALLIEAARRWFQTETEDIAVQACGVSDPQASLAAMVKLTDAIDHRLERGIRVLSLGNTAIAAVVETADIRREAVMTDLLTRAYCLDTAQASSAARLFHALHQAAVMRSPEDIKGYTRATIRHLVGWLSDKA